MFKYTTNRREYQEAELIKWLESQVKAGKVVNRSHYAQILSLLLSQIKNDSSPITTAKFVNPDQIVSSSVINEFMRNINIDIGSTYTEGTKIGNTLERRLVNSKKFFGDIKADIERLRKSISLQRSNAYGNIGSTQQIYVETFTSPSEFIMYDSIIDGKKGELRLRPYDISKYNKSENINRVELTVYPVDNVDGGVRYVSYPDKDIEKNYSSGSRNMLESGLWEMSAITDRDVELYLEGKKHSGIVAILDIWFETQNPINYIQYDAYGTYDQEILYIKYKTTENSDWKYIVSDGKAIRGKGNSAIEFYNFIPVNATAIRIAIKQDDRIIISKSMSDFSLLKGQMEDDMSMSRMGEETTWQDQYISSQPESDQISNLYESILSDIEKANSPEDAFKKIKERLLPAGLPDEMMVGKRLYTIGAHSIDIQNRSYIPNQTGIFYSHNPLNREIGYVVNPSTLVTSQSALLPSTISLEASYKTPAGSTAEFFIVDAENSIEIPIMPLSDTWYKEPAHFVRSQLNDRLVVQLTFPLAIPYTALAAGYEMKDFIKVYMNGILVEVEILTIDPTESSNYTNKSTRQFELIGINPNSLDIYSVEYKPDQISSAVAWIINPGSNVTNSNCLTDYKDKIFAKKFLADKKILEHGSGCKCKAVPTYISATEWSLWGLGDEFGSGYPYNSTKPPIPLYIGRTEKPGE